MRVGIQPRRPLRLLRAFVALSLATVPVVLSAGPASSQNPALLALRKTVALPPPAEAAPGVPFTYILSYSCSSLSAPCEGSTIVDVLPPELSHLVGDVELKGNFATASYDAATGTATFVLFNPLPAGTTAQVSISALFPPGTAAGTTALNDATMSASNGAPVRSNQVLVTAKAQSSWTVTKNVVPAGTPPQVDTPYTYRVGVTLAAGGTQNVDGIVMVDTLPAGAQFVSATGGGTFDPATNQVTWPPRNLVPNPNADVTTSEEVTVIFPAAAFPPGTSVLNVVVANGTPVGEPFQELGRAERPGIIRAAGSVTGGVKRATSPTLGPGQSDTYTLIAENPNTTPLAGFQVLETLPPQLFMVQDGSPNISGTGPPPVSITANPGGNVAITPGATWTATAPVSTGTLLFDYGTAPPNFLSTVQLRAGIPADGIDRNGQPIVEGQTFQNCIEITATGAITRRRCTTQTIVPVAVEFSKVVTSSPVTAIGQVVSWTIDVRVPPTSAGELVNPSISECLPPGLDLVDPLNPSNPINGNVSGFATLPTVTRTANGCGPNQTVITWSWTGSFNLAVGASGTFHVNTLVLPGTPPASLQNVVTLVADNLSVALVRVANVAVTSATLLEARKEVMGDRDTAFAGFPTVGNTTRGGDATFRVSITNVSDIAVTNIIVVDTLPIPGDTGVKDPSSRGSEWQPLFAGQFTSNPPFSAVEYSTSHNPCRPELTVNTPNCEPANWSASPPADLASVGSIRVSFGSLVLNPNDRIEFTWMVDTPADAPVGAVAWNSFAYVATRLDNGSVLEAAEPEKVGLQVETPGAPPPPELPPTGGSGLDLAGYVAAVLVLGGMVLTLYRRRPSARSVAS